MRIPLDYYRILGVPLQATAQQLSQAYHDRALQLPRREYSDAAITARKELLDEAYAVLSDPQRRSEYDANFLAKTYELDPQSEVNLPLKDGEKSSSVVEPKKPWIEIPKHQLVGALLILLELGDYEQVLTLGQPYLSDRSNLTLEKGGLGDPQLVRADLVLTLALACLEMCREQWQQGQYENAALSGELGQKLLLKEGFFPSLRGEMKSDLYKLRPYRILELLALPLEEVAQRQKGLHLLKEMLQERGGIEGSGDDQSGLNIDDFLRFIQQLRHYLTAEEQQTLFEVEARRPSAVATYLAVYAFLGRGFAQRMPELIYRAKEMLLRLGKRQDVHLEQAVCALLLGQTEEASRALELSQEYEPLAFIREHSQGSPDLLPGLCLYGERWLQAEVFPHFRDLEKEQTSLKDYFADDQVQRYLEQLPVDGSSESDNTAQWSVIDSGRANGTTVASSETRRSNGNRESAIATPSAFETSHRSSSSLSYSPHLLGIMDRGEVPSSTKPTHEDTSSLVAKRGLEDSATTAQEGHASSSLRPPRGSRRSSRARLQRSPSSAQDSLTPLGTASHDTEEHTPVPPQIYRSNVRGKSSAKNKRLLLVILAGVLGVGILGFVIVLAYNWVQNTLQSLSAPPLEGEQAMVELNQPLIEIPSPNARLATPDGPISTPIAKQAIETWLSTKAKAFGPDHQIDELNNILVEPILSTWKTRAARIQGNNAYWEYQHTVDVASVNTSEETPNEASIEAAVREVATFYQGGQVNQDRSYDDNLRVRYDLVRQDGKWKVKNMQVLN